MNIREYFAGVCTGMGWSPDEDRIDVFEFWAKQEGMQRTDLGPLRRLDFHWNPLATTTPGRRSAVDPFGAGPGKWNNANSPLGVGIYADAQAGIDATVATLSSTYFYGNIQRCFRDKVAYPEAIGPRDFASWAGEDAYGPDVVAFMAERFSRPATAAPESSVREIAREEAEKMVGGLFLPLLMQVLDLAPETFTDDKALAAIRAKLLAPAARVPAHTHSMNLIVTQTGGIQ